MSICTPHVLYSSFPIAATLSHCVYLPYRFFFLYSLPPPFYPRLTLLKLPDRELIPLGCLRKEAKVLNQKFYLQLKRNVNLHCKYVFIRLFFLCCPICFPLLPCISVYKYAILLLSWIL